MDLRVQLNETSYRLHRAVLIYKGRSGYADCGRIASVHEIGHREDEDGGGPRPVIETGRPLSASELERITKSLGREEQRAQLIPPRVLVSTRKTLIWYRRIGKKPIYFASDSNRLNALSGTALPHPSLVFKVHKGSLSVWAKRERGRPSADTILYHAPFFNVYSSGKVCTGSMEKPEDVAPQSIEAWERAFFRSAFTHGSGVAFLKGTPGYVDTLSALAQKVRQAETGQDESGRDESVDAPRFPTARLKRTGSRLADVIE